MDLFAVQMYYYVVVLALVLKLLFCIPYRHLVMPHAILPIVMYIVIKSSFFHFHVWPVLVSGNCCHSADVVVFCMVAPMEGGT